MQITQYSEIYKFINKNHIKLNPDLTDDETANALMNELDRIDGYITYVDDIEYRSGNDLYDFLAESAENDRLNGFEPLETRLYQMEELERSNHKFYTYENDDIKPITLDMFEFLLSEKGEEIRYVRN